MLRRPALLGQKSTLMDQISRRVSNSYQFIHGKLSVICSPILISVTQLLTYCMILYVKLIQTTEKDCFISIFFTGSKDPLAMASDFSVS
jgi:hypothetical protein